MQWFQYCAQSASGYVKVCHGVTVCSYSQIFTNKPGTVLIKNSLSDSSCITREGILKLRSFRDLNLLLIIQWLQNLGKDSRFLNKQHKSLMTRDART